MSTVIILHLPHRCTVFIWNKAVIDRRLRPRCCHLGSYTSFCHFLVAIVTCRDIMCKHDVINTQHAHCGLRPWLQVVVRASAACNGYSYAPNPRLRVSLTAPAWRRRRRSSLCTNMTSSIKLEIHNYHYAAEKDWVTAIGNMHKNWWRSAVQWLTVHKCVKLFVLNDIEENMFS